MKRLTLYTGILIIVALGATSCARKSNNDKIEVSGESFQQAELDDGPLCGCEEELHNYYYPTLVVFYNTPRPLPKSRPII